MADRRLGIGLAQVTTEPGRVAANRDVLEGAVRELAGSGAELVVLPELAVPGYTLRREVLEEVAEPLDGPTLSAWVDLSRATGTVIVGGFAERGDGGRLFNSVMGVGPDGPLLHYRKLHPFAGEEDVFAPGDLGLPVVQTPVGRIGVCVCYDLRFVEVLRLLSLRGAEVVCVPSAWVGGYDASSEASQVRTHGCPQSDNVEVQANLCQTFVACASHAGANDEFSFLGSSLLVDPFGRPVVGPASRADSSLTVAEADLAQLLQAQERGEGIRPREDRRTDVYQLEYGGNLY